MVRHRLGRPSAWTAALAAGLVSLALTGCGGSSHTPSRAAKTHPASAPTKSPASGGSPLNTGSVKATLVGQDHQPVANKNWTYTVHVADVHDRPLSGTLDTEFALGGGVVGKDTPLVHQFSHGHYREKLKFPATAIGYPLELQVVVHTPSGSVTLGWPVTVRK